MSTTFGINTTDFKDFELVDDEIPYWINKNIFERVAFRGSTIGWRNDMARFLPDETKVYPLDNSAQGIYTIGDIKKEILEQNK